MYSDYEVEQWYLGKPFSDNGSREEGGSSLRALSVEDIYRLFLRYPTPVS
jgi:hypothetical protein